MSALAKGTMFPETVESQIFNLVKGHSSLAKLSGQEALTFVGKDIFTFNFSNDIAIVGENEKKPVGDGVVAPVKMQPIKVVYQMRVSDEFMYEADEYKLNVLNAFADGFARKLGAGLDKMAIHGVDPKTGTESTIIGNNCFDKKVTTNTVTYSDPDVDIDSAVAQVEAYEYAVNGVVIAPAVRAALAEKRGGSEGTRLYPEFAFGATPATLGAMKLDTNATLSSNSSTDKAIVGDFANCFRWGIAKQLPMDIIEYGDPDNTGVDLKGSNQICLRSEAYIGWAIMDEKAFSLVK